MQKGYNKCDAVNKINTDNVLLCTKYAENRDFGATDSEGTVLMYSSGSSAYTKRFSDKDLMAVPSPGTGLEISHNRLIVSYARGRVKLWKMDTGECMRTINENRQTLGVIYNNKNQKFLTFGDNAELWLYDEETCFFERKFANSYQPGMVRGHTSRIFTAKFRPHSPNEFLSGGWDNTVHFWDLRQEFSLRYFTGPHICGEGIDFDTKGEQILTAGYQKDNALQIWSYSTGKLISNLDVGNDKLYCGKWLSNMYVAAGTSEASCLRVVNIFTGGTVVTYKMPQPLGIYSLDSYSKEKVVTSKPGKLNCRICLACNNTLTELDIQHNIPT